MKMAVIVPPEWLRPGAIVPVDVHTTGQLLAAVRELISLLEEAQKDQARYRYAKGHPHVMMEPWEPIFLNGEEIDAAIDQAMQSKT